MSNLVLEVQQKDDITYGISSSVAIAKAQRENLQVVYPKANELFIDIDSEADHKVFEENIDIIRQQYYTSSVKETPSKSGFPKSHIVVTLGLSITNTERILLQAVLGSDRKRELLGWIMELRGDLTPTLFLEKKQ